MPVLLHSTDITTLASSIVARAGNSSIDGLQVVCAWPVSGQYGPGSRVLYYVLVAASILARKSEWLRNACLAAALLVPVVAALHGIVLAALHVDGVMDMDVYGAFQFCAIGVLAAPVTVKLSSTYFNDRGRNLIFLWTILLLAGLLSLTVEFYRSNAVECLGDDGSDLPSSLFEIGTSLCGLDYCVSNQARTPTSPMRRGVATDIYVIPVPNRLTFGTATLLAAGCCIPAILSLVSIWIKILEVNWKSQFGPRDDHERIGGTKATEGRMRSVNEVIRQFLSVVEVPFFGAAVLAILIIGEINLFSEQVDYGTEPIGSVGQWTPIVGTVLATIGSLYLLLATDGDKTQQDTVPQPCTCSHHPGSRGRRSIETSSIPDHVFDSPQHFAQEARTSMYTVPSHSLAADSVGDARPSTSDPSSRHSDEPSTIHSHSLKRSLTHDEGGRLKIAKQINKVAEFFGTAAPDRFDDSLFQQGQASDFPELPGEAYRNRMLPAVRESYNRHREEDDSRSIRTTRSRAASFTGATTYSFGLDGSALTRSRTASPVRPRASPVAGEGSSTNQAPATDPTGARIRVRRDTLEVPAGPHTPRLGPSTVTDDPVVTVPADTSSPVIVISDSEAPISPNALGLVLADQAIVSEPDLSTRLPTAT